MFETIIQFNSDSYPFDTVEEQANLQVQTLLQCFDSAHFVENKKKFQTFKALTHSHCIKLNQIFQQTLIIHLIYQHIPTSLKGYLQHQILEYQNDNLLAFKKSILKTIAMELAELTEFFSNHKILTTLNFKNLGVYFENTAKYSHQIKYYLGIDFEFCTHSKQELLEFYTSERKKILMEIEQQLEMEKRSDYLPNFIIRGSRLIFTDELSQTKTRRKPKTKETEGGNQFRQKKKQNIRDKRSFTNSKQKKAHKYSCNFQEEGINFEFDNEKLNKSFEESETYSITQTRSMKIEMQHQKPNKKNRKNSIKFKITTFEEISIDQSLEQNLEQRFAKNTQGWEANCPEQNPDNFNSCTDKKDYKQKVKQAKQKAEALLTKYMKARNKSTCN